MGTSCEMSGRFSTGSPSPGKVCPLINAVLHVCIEQTYLDAVEQPSRPEFCDVRGRATRNQQRPLSRSHVRHPTHLQDRQWPYCLPTAVRAGTTEARPHLADRPPLASLQDATTTRQLVYIVPPSARLQRNSEWHSRASGERNGGAGAACDELAGRTFVALPKGTGLDMVACSNVPRGVATPFMWGLEVQLYEHRLIYAVH